MIETDFVWDGGQESLSLYGSLGAELRARGLGSNDNDYSLRLRLRTAF